jgi:hypothetical protein
MSRFQKIWTVYIPWPKTFEYSSKAFVTRREAYDYAFDATYNYIKWWAATIDPTIKRLPDFVDMCIQYHNNKRDLNIAEESELEELRIQLGNYKASMCPNTGQCLVIECSLVQ